MQSQWIRKPTSGASVVFVHGILSSGEACWRHEHGAYWPQLLNDEPDLEALGIYIYTYQTGFACGSYSLSNIVDDLKERFFTLDRIAENKKIVFVCHSMGGIVVRKFIVERVNDLLDRKIEIGLYLVASPSLGSKYANWLEPIAKFSGHSQAKALRFSQDNQWLNDLDKRFIDLKESKRLKMQGKELLEDKFVILKSYFRKQVVEPFSGARYFGESFKVEGSDHFSIAKPENKNADQHRLLIAFINELRSAGPPLLKTFVKTPNKQPNTVMLQTWVEQHGHHTLSPNPFSQTQSIREPIRFIGRHAEMRRLLTLLQGGSVVILGEPKIGKSSLLWQLVETFPGEVLGPLDLHEIENKNDLYVNLARHLGLSGDNWRDIRDTLKKRQSLLLVDEFDAGPRRGLDSEVLKQLRSICESNHNFKIVGASRNALREIYPDFPGESSPGYNVFQPMTIDEMTVDEARQLLNHPWALAPFFDSEAVEVILALAKGHPFKLQRAAFHYYETLSDPGHNWQAAWRQDMKNML